MYIAHFRERDRTEQSLIQHLQETAAISRKNGLPLKIPTICYLAGLLHDAGKFSKEFQEYILSAQQGKKVKRGALTILRMEDKLFLRFMHRQSLK